MADTHSLTRNFPSRDKAESTADRLVSAGFARNSVTIRPLPDDELALSIHVSPHNHARVEALLDGADWTHSAGDAVSAVADFFDRQPVPALLVAAGLGFLFGQAISR